MGSSEQPQAQPFARGNRFERILVPLDGSGAAESVLPTVAALCRKHSSKVVLVRIVDPPASGSGPSVEECAHLSMLYLSQVAATFEKQGMPSKVVARVGPITESLLAIAAEERISLIAMAVPFGEVGDKLFRSSSIPILAVPSGKPPSPGDPKHPVRTILVPLEGDGRADGIVPVAVDFGVSFGADLAVLLQVVPPTSFGRADAERYRAAEEHLGRLSRRFESKHISTSNVIVHGNPVTAILDLARDRSADVIAMSTRRAAPETAAGVLQQSEVPVLATE
ncbi:MAG: universal stress protein [Planctomycetota bacterium]|nr:MAG: universal stress protein [Planctomycetota bacterium]